MQYPDRWIVLNPLIVINSGSPGPAPIKYTFIMPLVSIFPMNGINDDFFRFFSYNLELTVLYQIRRGFFAACSYGYYPASPVSADRLNPSFLYRNTDI